MGFLGKLFEKKECSICGGPIGLMGNKKLEDGMAKNAITTRQGMNISMISTLSSM